MGRDVLTSEQRDALLGLVDIKQREGKPVTFASSDTRTEIRTTMSSETVGHANPSTVNLWEKCGHVTISGKGTERRFELTGSGLEYARRARMGAFTRNLLEFLDGWQSDLRSAIVSGVVSFIVSVATTLTVLAITA